MGNFAMHVQIIWLNQPSLTCFSFFFSIKTPTMGLQLSMFLSSTYPAPVKNTQDLLGWSGNRDVGLLIRRSHIQTPSLTSYHCWALDQGPLNRNCSEVSVRHFRYGRRPNAFNVKCSLTHLNKRISLIYINFFVFYI